MRLWFEGQFEGRCKGGLKHGLKVLQTNNIFVANGTTTLRGLKLGLKISLINVATP